MQPKAFKKGAVDVEALLAEDAEGNQLAFVECLRDLHRPGRPGGGHAPSAFPYANRFCTGLLYGRAGRLGAETAGFLARAVLSREQFFDGLEAGLDEGILLLSLPNS